MRHPRRLLSFTLLVGFSGVLQGQPIANWWAPAEWSPPAKAVLGVEVLGGVQTLVTSPMPFVGIDPCRIVDTRGNGFTGAYGPPALSPGVPRSFVLVGQCGIRGSAEAVSLNVTVTNTQGPGHIVIYPQGGAQPTVSTLNYVAGQTVANAAIVPLGVSNGITVVAGVSGTDLILDTNGYYGAPGTPLFNTFLGLGAGNATMIGNLNTGIGHLALGANTEGSRNTAVGNEALAAETTGTNNTAVGDSALESLITGQGNTAIGSGALLSNNGSTNTAVGGAALELSTGGANIALGYLAGSNVTTGNNSIFIGNEGLAADNNLIRIGSNQNATFVAGISGATSVSGVPVYVNTSGRLGTMTSSRRFKESVRAVGEDGEGLMSLRPVAFRYRLDLDPTGTTQYGLIAEEVAEVYPEMVVRDEAGAPQTVRYQLLDGLFLNEIQKQHRKLEAQATTIERQQARIDDLEQRLSLIEGCARR